MKKVSPTDANLPPFILDYLDDLARFYVSNLGKEFTKSVSALLSFTTEGISILSCTDERIIGVFEDMKKGCFAITPKEAKAEGISHLKTNLAKVSEEEKKKAREEFKGKKYFFINHYEHTKVVLGSSLETPAEIQLNIKAIDVTHQIAGGVTTAFLRFPLLYKDLDERFSKETRFSHDTRVCLVGPGLFEKKGSLSSSPQFVEIRSLFPNAGYLLLDNNKHVLEVLKGQFHNLKHAAYDPLMMQRRTCQAEGNKSYAPESFQGVFRKMKESFVEKAKYPSNAKEILAGTEPIKPLLVDVEPEKIELRQFDINTSTFAEEDKGKFDIVVGTMSIGLAVQNEKEKDESCDPLKIVRNFLELLKENGSLYIDSPTVAYLATLYGMEKTDSPFQEFERLLGGLFSFEEIPLSDFLPGIQENSGLIEHLYTDKEKTNKGGSPCIPTTSLVVITRN